MQGARFWVERSFQDAKSECGMADYQVRRWDAWHHHMAMVMIAMLFMLNERLLHKQEMPLLSCNDIVYCLKHYLPRKACNKDELLELIRIRHKKRQVAIDSAIKRQKKSLE
jgi:SRSO17 transposase